MNFTNRSYQAELLDGDDIPFADIQQNMQELNTINTWLGGHAITLKGVQQLIGNRKTIHICEIGCGGGDNLLAIYKWCMHKQIKVLFTGIDIQSACIKFAKNNAQLKSVTEWIVSDYATVTFAQQPDIILSSLFCHHFTNQQLVQQLVWMQQNSTVGFFINDLHRHPLAYYSIQFITKIFSRSYLVKNDAPLSVARGFTKNEWELLLQNAQITNYTIDWKWAFRHLICYHHA